MIYYFSGTGNSRRVANTLAEALSVEAVDVGQLIKNGESHDASLYSGPYMFVSPTYAWRIPRLFEKWIKETPWSLGQKAYFVMTCGDDIGAAGQYLAKLCQDIGLEFYGVSPVVMPENYLAVFPVPDEKLSDALVRKGVKKAKHLADIIKGGHPILMTGYSKMDKIKSGVVNACFYPLIVGDLFFRVGNDCNSCGTCQKVCPLNNISLENGRPKWHRNCTHCMACIARCPQQCIEYGLLSKGKRRHYLD